MRFAMYMDIQTPGAVLLLVVTLRSGRAGLWFDKSRCVSKRKQVMCVQAAALCYVPATRNYWVTGQHGNVHAFDPRAPGDVTPFIKATRFPRALSNSWLLCIWGCHFNCLQVVVHDLHSPLMVLLLWKVRAARVHCMV